MHLRKPEVGGYLRLPYAWYVQLFDLRPILITIDLRSCLAASLDLLFCLQLGEGAGGRRREIIQETERSQTAGGKRDILQCP